VERTSGAFASKPGGPPKRSPIRELLARPIRDPDPILLKELRATFRTPAFIRFLYLSTALVGLGVVGWGASMAAGNTAPAEVGRTVFQVFFSLLLSVICLVAPGFAATAITSEREAHTYESLLLSGMSGTRMVMGKLAAYVASIGLVVVAIAPVVGVAFLFGGISPLAVLTGFLWVFYVLVVATAFGIAISAHVQTTRVAIVLATIIATPVSFSLTGMMTGLGEEAGRSWSVGFEGPFWFAHAFAERLDHLDTWVLLGLVPIYVFGMPTWFFVASAVAGVVPPSNDRSTALKLWAVAAAVGAAFVLAIPTFLSTGAGDAGEAAVAMSVIGMGLPYFFGLVLCNEPPLPPVERGKPTALRQLWSLVGPGAASSLRFTFALIVLTCFGIAGAASVSYHLSHPALDHFITNYDWGLFALALGQSCVAALFAATGTTLRLWLRNGAAARALTVALFAGVILLALIVMTAMDPGSFDRLDREVPPLFALSPMGVVTCAVLIANGHDAVGSWALLAVASLGYAMLAVALWIGVELRVRSAFKLVADRKAKLEGKLSAPTRPAAVPEAPTSATPALPEASGSTPDASSTSDASSSAPGSSSTSDTSTSSSDASEPPADASPSPSDRETPSS
jgi:hypothetical protein